MFVIDVHGKPDCKRGSGCGRTGLGDRIVEGVVLMELSFGETFGVVDCCFDTQCAHRETHHGFLGGATVYFDVSHDKESVVFLGCLCIREGSESVIKLLELSVLEFDGYRCALVSSNFYNVLGSFDFGLEVLDDLITSLALYAPAFSFIEAENMNVFDFLDLFFLDVFFDFFLGFLSSHFLTSVEQLDVL